MHEIDKVLKELKTPEGQEKVDAFIKEYIEKQQIEDEKIKSMLSNTSYVEWLKKFTKNKDDFDDEEWVYCPEQLSEIDSENVRDLYLFYRGIERYARSNNIVPNYFDFGEYYKVKYNDFYFKIGHAHGQGSIVFFSKIIGRNLKGFINFNNVIANNNSNADKISNLLIAMQKGGISNKEIEDTINNSTNKSKKRVLIKEKDNH